MTPESVRAVASKGSTEGIRLEGSCGSRRSPGTSETKSNLAGLRVHARAAAARSALMLRAFPEPISQPRGETTGIASEAMVFRISSVWQDSTLPTRPISTATCSDSVIRVAWNTSVPGIPVACPPCLLRRSTRAGLMVLPRVASTIEIASELVTRKPSTNLASRPAASIAAEIALPPP